MVNIPNIMALNKIYYQLKFSFITDLINQFFLLLVKMIVFDILSKGNLLF